MVCRRRWNRYIKEYVYIRCVFAEAVLAACFDGTLLLRLAGIV
jgi:hypothetical protein